MKIPGFNAEDSLKPATGTYESGTVLDRFSSEGGDGVVSQFGISSDPDLGSYLRCRANGGSELVCRFFGGLPPFTIGRFSIGR
jgi:hypothetical protein